MSDATPPGTPEAATDRLVYLLNRVTRSFNRAAWDVADRFGIRVPQLMALLVLGEGEPLSYAQLARRTFVTPQAGHQVAVQLVKAGLIASKRAPDNGRNRMVELTDEGWRVVTECRAALADLETRALAELPARDQDVLRRGLLQTANTLAGGWFGDAEAEAASAERRALSSGRHASA